MLPSVVAHIDAGRLRPNVAVTCPLRKMKATQAAFEGEGFLGKIAALEVA